MARDKRLLINVADCTISRISLLDSIWRGAAGKQAVFTLHKTTRRKEEKYLEAEDRALKFKGIWRKFVPLILFGLIHLT